MTDIEQKAREYALETDECSQGHCKDECSQGHCKEGFIAGWNACAELMQGKIKELEAEKQRTRYRYVHVMTRHRGVISDLHAENEKLNVRLLDKCNDCKEQNVIQELEHKIIEQAEQLSTAEQMIKEATLLIKIFKKTMDSKGYKCQVQDDAEQWLNSKEDK